MSYTEIEIRLDDAEHAMLALCAQVEQYAHINEFPLDHPRWKLIEAAARIAVKVRAAQGFTGPYVNDSPFNDAIAWLCSTGLVTPKSGREEGTPPPPMLYEFCPIETMDGMLDLPPLRVAREGYDAP